jgi:hypothetical protein
VSKERARRRAEREAAAAIVVAQRERQAARLQRRIARRARRRALAARILPARGRRAWLLGRRNPGQRAAIAGLTIGVLWLLWYLVPPLSLRIAFTLLFILLLPVLVTLTFDRKV